MASTTPSNSFLAAEGAPLAMPTGVLLATVFAAGAATAILWAGAVFALRMPAEVMQAGLVGAGIVTVIALGGVLVMLPWIPRSIMTWTSTWIGSSVFRLLVTPAVTFVLYSATSLPPVPLVLGVAGAYLVVLLSEAAILARIVNRHPKT